MHCRRRPTSDCQVAQAVALYSELGQRAQAVVIVGSDHVDRFRRDRGHQLRDRALVRPGSAVGIGDGTGPRLEAWTVRRANWRVRDLCNLRGRSHGRRSRPSALRPHRRSPCDGSSGILWPLRFQIGDDVGTIEGIGQAGISHRCPRNIGSGVHQPDVQAVTGPGPTDLTKRGRIAEAAAVLSDGASENSVQVRAISIRRAGLDRVAHGTLAERDRAGGRAGDCRERGWRRRRPSVATTRVLVVRRAGREKQNRPEGHATADR